MISTRISEGTTASATRRNSPVCMAHSTATCRAITLNTMVVLRLMAGKTPGWGNAELDMGKKGAIRWSRPRLATWCGWVAVCVLRRQYECLSIACHVSG